MLAWRRDATSMTPPRPRPQPLWARVEIDQFAAQALLAATPTLAKIPFAVVRQREDGHKASLFAVSRRASELGACPGMPVFIARRKVGDRFRTLPRDERAESAVRATLSAVYGEWTPVFESATAGSWAWLDLSGTPISRAVAWEDIGRRLSAELKARSGLCELAVGVSVSRVVAQILARQALPDSVIACPVGQEQAQLATVDADSLPGLASACRERAQMYGLEGVDQLLDLDRATLVRRFGKQEGGRIYGLVRGMASEPRRSAVAEIEAETVLRADINDEVLLHEAVRLTADKATHDLRRAGLAAHAIRLTLLYSDNRRAQKTARLLASTDIFDRISAASLAAFDELHVRRVALKSLHVAALRTSSTTGQRDLFDGIHQHKRRRLGAAITDIRQRLGFDAVLTGGALSLDRE